MTFDEVYDIMNESEKKDILSLLVKEVHINANDVGAKTLLRKIIFNFPVYYNNDNEADGVTLLYGTDHRKDGQESKVKA